MHKLCGCCYVLYVIYFAKFCYVSEQNMRIYCEKQSSQFKVCVAMNVQSCVVQFSLLRICLLKYCF
jgi:hypothetical protein